MSDCRDAIYRVLRYAAPILSCTQFIFLSCEAQSAGVAKATASIGNVAGREKKETKITWSSSAEYKGTKSSRRTE